MKISIVKLCIIGLLSLSAGFFSASFSAGIISSHPRLFFRSESWAGGAGLTLDTIRKRAVRPEAAYAFSLLEGSLPNDALRSLLQANPDSADFYARRAIDSITQPIDMNDLTTEQGVELMEYAMVYDWLYSHPSFTEKKKKQAADNMAEAAESLMVELEGDAHIFHTRMYGWATGVAFAGLALAGDGPRADKLADFAGNYYKDNLFPARELQDGSVHNGFGYGRKYCMWLTGHFISCRYSATGENLWQSVAEDQGDWARDEIYFNIYGRYPDGTYLRYGDSYSISSDQYSFRAVSERTAAYADHYGSGFLKKLLDENAGRVLEKPSAYVYFLFYDPDLAGLPENELPPARLFSRDGTGMVVWKSGWEKKGTTIFFKCGDYFGDHGHFDQGHVSVYRKAPLLVDSGDYLTFSGEFRTEYWHRTVAHNTILIIDPAVENDRGEQRVFSSQSDATIEEYNANPLSETGDIIDYRELDGLYYVAGDFTSAYPTERARRVTRELAFVDGKYLVVLDRIAATRDGFQPRVLWHCAVYPDIITENYRFKVDRNGGRAIVTTLWPQNAGAVWIDSFTVNGRKIEPVGKYQPTDDMGVGRFEISGAGLGKEQIFVHLVEITDSPADPNIYDPPLAEVACTVDDKGIRVEVEGYKLVFDRDKPGLILK